ncbi:MAG: hypothetical protein M0Q52_11880, partial [Lascolabacillus sp.]|nr:hypothetical protein [Lascolabacillus sp.]
HPAPGDPGGAGWRKIASRYREVLVGGLTLFARGDLSGGLGQFGQKGQFAIHQTEILEQRSANCQKSEIRCPMSENAPEAAF